ncbi:hypothetical protein M9H77_22318 [Catharanthus roseus]|uniref:Uncharacterized protein n=1 Tax=Catharanthus roseus TaxID=4058 RepID=A0ACC0AQ62_CATRO|nr:hypothetical protein M9H77_22318 [Catharanthus roseus]
MIMKEEAHRKLILNTDAGSEAVVFATPKSVQWTHCFKSEHEAKNCYLLVGFPNYFDGDVAGGRQDRSRNSFTWDRGCGWGGRSVQRPPTHWAANAAATRSSSSERLTWTGHSNPADAAPFSHFVALWTDHSCGWAAAASATALEGNGHSGAAQTMIAAEAGPPAPVDPLQQPSSARESPAQPAAAQPSAAQIPSAQPPSVHPSEIQLVSAHLPTTQTPSALSSFSAYLLRGQMLSAVHLFPPDPP